MIYHVKVAETTTVIKVFSVEADNDIAAARIFEDGGDGELVSEKVDTCETFVLNVEEAGF